VRTIRYREIADDLRTLVVDGDAAPGRLLPSEAVLSRDYGASRATIRKALEALRDEGLVDSRQGFGWFVASDPLRQDLVRLGTIESQLVTSGRRSDRRVLDFGFVTPTGRVRDVLGEEQVLRVRRRGLADGQPFVRVTIWCPQRWAAEISRADAERSSFQELLPVTLAGATQTIGAGPVSAEDASVLGLPEGAPVLLCERITRSVAGEPVLLSDHVFPAHLTEFVVELPGPETLVAPSGLRLVR
jgi:GntR family transcriptional regulator